MPSKPITVLQAGALLAVCVGAMATCSANRWGLFARQEQDLTVSAKDTWREEIKEYLAVPPSATLRSYIYSVGPAVSDRTLIFTLPPDKEPQVWLQTMTHGRELGKFRQSALLYEGHPNASHSMRIEYREQDGTYVLVISYS